jgi:hypothetical protein
MRKLKYSFVIIFLSFAMPAFSQSKPGISDTCDMLTLWGGSKIYCKVKSLSDVVINYVSCTDSAKKPTFIVRTKVHYWVHPDNSYIVISYDSIIQPPPHPPPIKVDTVYKGESIEHKVFVSAGLGYSTLGTRIYGLLVFEGGLVSESWVYNGAIDYGIKYNTTLGLAMSYQEATGVPLTLDKTGQADNSEYFTRFNCGFRVLHYIVHTYSLFVYSGFRLGISYWRDIPIDINEPSKIDAVTTLGDQSIYPSIQVLFGCKLIYRVIGLHLEVGIGTPYFAEAGLSIKI